MFKIFGIILILIAIFISLGSLAFGIDLGGNLVNIDFSWRWIAGIVGGLLLVFG